MIEQIKNRIAEINQGKVPEGYKKTEVGIIPFDWNVSKLIDTSVNGISNGIFNDPDKKGNGVLLVNVVDLYNEPYISIDNLERLEISKKEFDIYKLNKYDILFTRSSLKLEGIAHCNIFCEDVDAVYDCHIMKMSPNMDVYSPMCLKHYFVSYNARKQFMYKAKTTTMTTIGQKDIEDVSIALPELHEQQKIAEILMKWDEAIALQEKLIEKLELQKKALLQRLLNPQKNWKKIKIGELVQEKTMRNKNDCQNVLSVSNRYGFIKQEEQFSKQVASADVKNYKVINKGDIAYNPSRINVGSIALYENEEPGIVSPMYIVVECKKINPTLLLLLLNTSKGKYNIESFLSGSVRDSLNYSDLAEIEVHLPDDIIAEKIINLNKAISKQLLVHQQKLNAIKLQQKSLMQLLLTGIVSV